MKDWVRRRGALLLFTALGAIVVAGVGAYFRVPRLEQGLVTAAGGGAGYLLRWLVVERRVTLEHEYRVIEDQRKRLHRYVEAYYLPYIRKASNLARALRHTPLDDELCFYELAQFIAVCMKWLYETPVLMLEDRTGERVIEAMEARVVAAFARPFGKGDRSEVEKHTKTDELYVDWVNKTRAGGPLHTIFAQKFQPWARAANLDELAKWLCSLARLFEFELDMCYRTWYGKSPPKPTTGTERIDDKLIAACLNELVLNGDIDEADKSAYLRRIGAKPKHK